MLTFALSPAKSKYQHALVFKYCFQSITKVYFLQKYSTGKYMSRVQSMGPIDKSRAAFTRPEGALGASIDKVLDIQHALLVGITRFDEARSQEDGISALKKGFSAQARIYTNALWLVKVARYFRVELQDEYIQFLSNSIIFMMSNKHRVEIKSDRFLLGALPSNFIKAYIFMGHAYLERGQFSTATSYYREAFAQETHDKRLLTSASLSISDVSNAYLTFHGTDAIDPMHREVLGPLQENIDELGIDFSFFEP
jgi:hypothetical protein